MTEAVLAAGPSNAGPQEYLDAMRVARDGADVAARAADLCVFPASRASDGITGRLLAAMWDPWPMLSRHVDELRDSDVYALRRIVPKDRRFNWDPGQ
jgi:3-oxoacyl-[acyl-carrier protein] reductase